MVPTSLVSLSRAIGMLEGIALEANPEFNIVSDSFPFILGQLIQDPHPRVRGALRFMVYGPTGVFDMQRCASHPPALTLGSFQRHTRRHIQHGAAS